jgi:hypothetical protein
MNNNLGFRMMPTGIKRKNTFNHKLNNDNSYITKNMRWGTVTWKLFHWIATNIDEEFYKKSRFQLHSIIRNILHNLPCPTCKQHALEFLRKYDISKAVNKSQFIQYFYFFHNKVNARRKIADPPRTILDDYAKMNGVLVINDWAKDFKNILGINLNDFMNKQNITKVKNNMLEFLKTNRQYFSNL